MRTAEDFFDRARARLTLDVPPALTDPLAQGARGDLDLNPAMWERAGVSATRPAAVLVPIIDRSEPTVLLTHPHRGTREPCRTGGVSGRQDRSRR